MPQRLFPLVIGACCLLPLPAMGEDGTGEPFTRKEDVIYARKFGTALTMDVFTPARPKGIGILWMVSGGWYSDKNAVHPDRVKEILGRGYTVFAVVHGSQPKYTIPEILEDIHRAVRFVRHHARDYGVDPDRLGITGGSAGGHLSLMLGTTGKDGDPGAKDPVERQSSRVQAVACFFPPTDFLNYGKPGEDAIGRGILKDFHAPFDFHEYDSKTKSFVLITQEERIVELGKTVSPLTHVTPDDAPALIVHGDADKLVPIQQGEIMVEALKKAGVPAKLVTKPGAGHGWARIGDDMAVFADWFDEHLARGKPGATAGVK